MIVIKSIKTVKDYPNRIHKKLPHRKLKTFLRENTKDLNRGLKSINFKQNTIKIIISSKLIYSFNTIQMKISAVFLHCGN